MLCVTFASSNDRYVSRARTNVENNRTLYPGNEEMSTLARYLVLDAGEAIEYYRSVASIN